MTSAQSLADADAAKALHRQGREVLVLTQRSSLVVMEVVVRPLEEGDNVIVDPSVVVMWSTFKTVVTPTRSLFATPLRTERQ